MFVNSAGLQLYCMNRQRRRRATVEGEATEQKEQPYNTPSSVGQGKVMFMEEVDYKMEVHETQNDSKKVLLKNEQFSED